jgi:putative ATP-binding cassette transporter
VPSGEPLRGSHAAGWLAGRREEMHFIEDRMSTERSAPAAGPTFLASGVKIDLKSQKIDKVFFRRLWEFCRPFWTRKGAWTSYLLVAVLLAASLAASGATGVLTVVVKAYNNALVAKNPAAYWDLVLSYLGLALAALVGLVIVEYVSSYIRVVWRRWSTTQLVDDYLGARTYYVISRDGDIDNPDQRIQEEIKPVIEMLTQIPLAVIQSSQIIVIQAAILASLSLTMLFATIGFCVLNAVVTYFVNKPTIKQNWESTIAEADFRFGLLHVRDHAEIIAFYRGEKGERAHLTDRLSVAVLKQWVIARYHVIVSMAAQFLSITWMLAPLCLMPPLYFAGLVEFGTIAAATTAGTLIAASINKIIMFMPVMAQSVPHIVRLAQIREKSAQLRSDETTQRIGHLRRQESDSSIGFHNVTLMTPGGERTLLQSVTAEIAKGGRMLIVGPTGTGKSSALRAMAGLWNLGHGTINTPPEAKTIYLPQHPYMVLGSLRAQLLYPGTSEDQPTDEQIVEALHAACLGDLAQRYPDLSVAADWGHVLSLGEQQRFGFARAYLSTAEFLFLDEATSAVDVETERKLYTELLTRPITLVSVGHRPSLLLFHERVLDLRADGTGAVMSSEAYMANAAAQSLKRTADELESSVVSFRRDEDQLLRDSK